MAADVGPVDLGFRAAIRRLDAAGRLLKVLSTIDPELEVAGLMRTERERALFFANVGGYSIPVCANLLVNTTNVTTIFNGGVATVRACMTRGLEQPLKPRIVDSGPCQEVVHTSDIDLESLPILRYCREDGGRFITAGIVIAKNPATGVRNASIHRLQLLGKDGIALKLDPGRHLRTLFEMAQRLGKPLEIAVAIGTDLSLLYSAASTGAQVPFDMDEFDVASGIQGSPLEVVKCRTVDLEVPAKTEIVIEGQVLPGRMVEEGPFIDFLGLLSPKGQEPVVKVTCLSHRKQPVYFVLLANGDTLTKFISEAGLLKAVKATSPIVQDLELTAGSLNKFHLVISVKKTSPMDEGLQRNAILAAWAAFKDVDHVTVVDDDIDIRNPQDVEWALSTRFNADEDLILSPATKCHPYVPCAKDGTRCKMGMDATVPVQERARFVRAEYARVDISKHKVSVAPGTRELSEAFGAFG